MDANLIDLLRLANTSIAQYITIYLTVAGATAVFVMTDTYTKNFNHVGKLILSVLLFILSITNWVELLYYHEIYNGIIFILNQTENIPNIPHIATLLGDSGALVSKATWKVHVGQISGGLLVLSIIWWKSLQQRFGARLKNWYRDAKR